MDKQTKKEPTLATITEARAYLTALARRANRLERRLDKFAKEPIPDFPVLDKLDPVKGGEAFDKAIDEMAKTVDKAGELLDKALADFGDALDLMSEYHRVIDKYPELRDEFHAAFE